MSDETIAAEAEASVAAPDSETVLAAQDTTDAAGDQKPDEADAALSEQPDGEKPDGEAEPDGGEIEYGDFEMPEGFELDETAMANALPVFKELGLKQDQAQKLVSLYAAEQARLSEGFAVQAKEQADAWVAEIKTEWGAKWDDNLAIASKAVDFGGDALRQALNETGAGNHPAVIKFFHRVGQALSEDTLSGKSQGKAEKSLQDKLYPSMSGGG